MMGGGMVAILHFGYVKWSTDERKAINDEWGRLYGEGSTATDEERQNAKVYHNKTLVKIDFYMESAVCKTQIGSTDFAKLQQAVKEGTEPESVPLTEDYYD